MKTILTYIAVFFLTGLFAACEDLKFGNEFLDKAPGGDVTIDTVFASKVTAEAFLATGYSSLFYGFPTKWENVENRMGMEMLETLTDLVQGIIPLGSGLYYDGAYSAGTEDNDQLKTNTKYGFTQEGSWKGIRNAYIYLQNVDRVPDMTPEEKKVRKGEAKMIIACHYVDMLRHFGGLPWIDKAIYPEDDTNYPRLSLEETVNHLTTLLDEAANDLPWALANVAVDDGRFTRAAALGLKIRVLLFVASPLFNSAQPYMDGPASDQKMTWLGGKDMKWYNQAEQACIQFFSEMEAHPGAYDIVNTGAPRADFIKGYHVRGNGELLISTRKVYKSGGLWDTGDKLYYFYQQHCNYGSGSTTLDAVDMFQFTDGTYMDWSNPTQAKNPFFTLAGVPKRDPRLYETTTIQGDKMQGKRLDIYTGPTNGWLRKVGNATCWLTGFGIRKFVRERMVGNGFAEVVQWPYLRLPEIYLSYAEILNELGREDEAYAYIKPVRDRAQMPNLNHKGNLGKDELRKEILLERAREFMYEEVRWYDIIRWKQEDIFKKRLRGLQMECLTNDGKNITFRPYDLVKDRVWRTNFSPKWYLSAFPPSEINKEYGLVQNPGW